MSVRGCKQSAMAFETQDSAPRTLHACTCAGHASSPATLPCPRAFACVQCRGCCNLCCMPYSLIAMIAGCLTTDPAGALDCIQCRSCGHKPDMSLVLCSLHRCRPRARSTRPRASPTAVPLALPTCLTMLRAGAYHDTSISDHAVAEVAN